ncbi:TetR/AcrR family transcriptional regulator [Actinomadura napierensis]|uniref:TetR/AcrR family transcriptional regulator n=1 Tax=Actinomadura napierensis TaxID=267854 RepID=A0ABN2ZM02_9ACTN
MTAGAGRADQKARTRRAIVDACRDLARSGAEVTMPQVAKHALVSEATAYRYFPDLVSLLQEALEAVWPGPEEALAPVAASSDPARRVAFATEYLLRHVHTHQGAVRAMISHTIAAPPRARARPGLRFALIDHVLAPFDGLPPAALARLKQSLALACGAEAFFVLTDLCGLSPDDAVATAVETATTLTEAAFAGETRKR